MSQIIKFHDISGKVPEEYWSVPAVLNLPEWYSRMESYVGNQKYPPPGATGKTMGTAKKCMPLFDAITAGYLIRLHADVLVRKIDGLTFFQWPTGDPISFQSIDQIKNYPGQDGRRSDYPKFSHNWSIQTPAGYSVMITSPIHRDNVFTLMEAVVDTDSYHLPIAFPFTLKDENFEGLIPAGTPIAQVIPFKRTDWKSEIISSEKLSGPAQKTRQATMSVFINGYKNKLWSRKSYK